MKLRYYRVKSKLRNERDIPKGFLKDMKLIDNNLDVVFNRLSGRFEIYRYSQGTYHWILEVENEDSSYRPLDNRTIRKLYDMDIISRWGSVRNFERHLDEKQKKWKDEKQKEMDFELKCDLRDDRRLWQMAAENARSGVFDNPPIQKDKKIVSYQK